MSTPDSAVAAAFELAVERYAAIGVDVAAVLKTLATIAVSLHCWQGDDVAGFENPGLALGGGLAVTGNYPGKARSADELRADLEQAFALIPGRHRLNLHAIYAETGGQSVERDALEPRHFQGWIDWARDHGAGIDFNPTFFSHPMAVDGNTLSHADPGIRQFWVDHGIACRSIGAFIGESLGSPCVNNTWIADGSKDQPIDRKGPRERLTRSLDAIFARATDPRFLLDAVEAKLFGLGSEAYVVGSHEYYLGYATTRQKMLCLDAGHFHPTEVIADKISSVLAWVPEVLLHVSRGVRWDSDHVVTLTDDLQAIAQEAVRGGFLDRIHFGLDYFDASINRVAAWVIGTRALLKGLLLALLEPIDILRAQESGGDFTGRLALLEECKSYPWGAVWDYYCLSQNVPIGAGWIGKVQQYERGVLAGRGASRISDFRFQINSDV